VANVLYKYRQVNVSIPQCYGMELILHAQTAEEDQPTNKTFNNRPAPWLIRFRRLG